MPSITYKQESSSLVYVKLDGKLVGQIKHKADGWRYHPKGSKLLSPAFHTLGECKAWIEGDG